MKMKAILFGCAMIVGLNAQAGPISWALDKAKDGIDAAKNGIENERDLEVANGRVYFKHNEDEFEFTNIVKRSDSCKIIADDDGLLGAEIEVICDKVKVLEDRGEPGWDRERKVEYLKSILVGQGHLVTGAWNSGDEQRVISRRRSNPSAPSAGYGSSYGGGYDYGHASSGAQ